jgi:hypothetical protein
VNVGGVFLKLSQFVRSVLKFYLFLITGNAVLPNAQVTNNSDFPFYVQYMIATIYSTNECKIVLLTKII